MRLIHSSREELVFQNPGIVNHRRDVVIVDELRHVFSLREHN